MGEQVQRLERQVESAQRSTGGLARVFSALGQGLNVAAGFGAIQAGVRGVQSLFDLLGESIVGANARLEQTTATFRAFTGSASQARAIVEQLSREADITPFDTREVLEAGQALISTARGSQDALMELIRTAEVLAALRPEQGLVGAAVAIREATEGNLESIRERFGVSTEAIRRFQAQGQSAAQAIRSALQEMGADSRLVQLLAESFGGLWSNVASAFAEIRRRLGEGVFERLKDGLVAVNDALTRNRDAIYAWATRVGAILGAVVAQIGSVLGELAVRLLNWIDPGSGDRLRELFSGVTESVQDAGDAAADATPQVQALSRALSLPEARQALEGARGNLKDLQTLTAQTARPVEALARELGAAGLAAAELQFQADRVRDAYQRQLEPLERQLRTLQQSADVQRVQNALASNRATVERLRLEREIVALRSAAGSRTDPDQAGLTLRQRLIALALQDRQLQLQQLGLEEERRPLVQSLQERIEAINEEQRRALEPIQVQIAAQRERVDLLQLERQRWEGLRQDIQGAVDAINNAPVQPKTAAPDQGEVETRKQELERIGKEFGERFQKGWDEWVAAGGGDMFKAISAHLEQWYADVGKPLAERIGKDLGAAIGDALGTALPGAITRAVRTALGVQGLSQDPIGDWVRQRLEDAVESFGRAREVGAPVIPPGAAAGAPGPLPLTQPPGVAGAVPALPRVAPEVAPLAQPAPVAPVTVNVSGVDVTIGEGASRDEIIDQLTAEVGREVATAIVESLEAAAPATDPGPGRRVQGPGRAP